MSEEQTIIKITNGFDYHKKTLIDILDGENIYLTKFLFKNQNNLNIPNITFEYSGTKNLFMTNVVINKTIPTSAVTENFREWLIYDKTNSKINEISFCIKLESTKTSDKYISKKIVILIMEKENYLIFSNNNMEIDFCGISSENELQFLWDSFYGKTCIIYVVDLYINDRLYLENKQILYSPIKWIDGKRNYPIRDRTLLGYNRKEKFSIKTNEKIESFSFSLVIIADWIECIKTQKITEEIFFGEKNIELIHLNNLCEVEDDCGIINKKIIMPNTKFKDFYIWHQDNVNLSICAIEEISEYEINVYLKYINNNWENDELKLHTQIINKKESNMSFYAFCNEKYNSNYVLEIKSDDELENLAGNLDIYISNSVDLMYHLPYFYIRKIDILDNENFNRAYEIIITAHDNCIGKVLPEGIVVEFENGMILTGEFDFSDFWNGFFSTWEIFEDANDDCEEEMFALDIFLNNKYYKKQIDFINDTLYIKPNEELSDDGVRFYYEDINTIDFKIGYKNYISKNIHIECDTQTKDYNFYVEGKKENKIERKVINLKNLKDTYNLKIDLIENTNNRQNMSISDSFFMGEIKSLKNLRIQSFQEEKLEILELSKLDNQYLIFFNYESNYCGILFISFVINNVIIKTFDIWINYGKNHKILLFDEYDFYKNSIKNDDFCIADIKIKFINYKEDIIYLSENNKCITCLNLWHDKINPELKIEYRFDDDHDFSVFGNIDLINPNPQQFYENKINENNIELLHNDLLEIKNRYQNILNNINNFFYNENNIKKHPSHSEVLNFWLNKCNYEEAKLLEDLIWEGKETEPNGYFDSTFYANLSINNLANYLNWRTCWTRDNSYEKPEYASYVFLFIDELFNNIGKFEIEQTVKWMKKLAEYKYVTVKMLAEFYEKYNCPERAEIKTTNDKVMAWDEKQKQIDKASKGIYDDDAFDALVTISRWKIKKDGAFFSKVDCYDEFKEAVLSALLKLDLLFTENNLNLNEILFSKEISYYNAIIYDEKGIFSKEEKSNICNKRDPYFSEYILRYCEMCFRSHIGFKVIKWPTELKNYLWDSTRKYYCLAKNNHIKKIQKKYISLYPEINIILKDEMHNFLIQNEFKWTSYMEDYKKKEAEINEMRRLAFNQKNIEEKIFCPKCGVELTADSIFCNKCGEKVSF